MTNDTTNVININNRHPTTPITSTDDQKMVSNTISNTIKILQCPVPACDFSITKIG